MSGWFLIIWIMSGSGGVAWPEMGQAKLVGPIPKESCMMAEEQIMRHWQVPIFAKCTQINR